MYDERKDLIKGIEAIKLIWHFFRFVQDNQVSRFLLIAKRFGEQDVMLNSFILSK